MTEYREQAQPLTTAQPCEVHKTHVPNTHVNEIHHIWPLGDGGPNVSANRVVICATGHNSVHELLRQYRIHGGTPAKFVMRGYTAAEKELAALGWARIQRGAL